MRSMWPPNAACDDRRKTCEAAPPLCARVGAASVQLGSGGWLEGFDKPLRRLRFSLSALASRSSRPAGPGLAGSDLRVEGSRLGSSMAADGDTMSSASSGFPLHPAQHGRYSAPLRRRSSVVERILGKAEVPSSILGGGTSFSNEIRVIRSPLRGHRACDLASKSTVSVPERAMALHVGVGVSGDSTRMR